MFGSYFNSPLFRRPRTAAARCSLSIFRKQMPQIQHLIFRLEHSFLMCSLKRHKERFIQATLCMSDGPGF